MKKLLYKITAVFMMCCIVFTGCEGKKSVKQKKTVSSDKGDGDWTTAENTPFAAYPETVEYRLGKMAGSNNSNMPEGDTYENNAYTRYLKKILNVQNIDVFEIADHYEENVSMVISSKKLPDIMVLSDMNLLKTLVNQGMVEDLSEVYQKCASERIKSIYESYGSDIFEPVTFNGKLMALPETNIDNGPNLLWLRKDWMDQLGLSEPKTVQDAVHIIEEFQKKDPGDNGKGQTVGLVCTNDVTGGSGYSSEYQTDILFAAENAFPKQWIKGENGKIVYGSVQPEAKAALKVLRRMYQRGSLDNDFLVRGTNNIIDLITSGKCGSFFGPWWAPNNPLMNAMKDNPDADWEPYLLETDGDGNTVVASQKPNGSCVVVRKGYEHPEIVMKIMSAIFDDLHYGDEGLGEMEQYYQQNVDPTARPIAINIDYKDALNRCYRALSKTLNGENDADQLQLLEGSYYRTCIEYQKELGKSKDLIEKDSKHWENWAAYKSRITACSLLSSGKIKEKKSYYFPETTTMTDKWWKLEELEKNAYLKIISGDKDLSYFDEFVEEWKKQGGDEITQEVNQSVKEKKTAFCYKK